MLTFSSPIRSISCVSSLADRSRRVLQAAASLALLLLVAVPASGQDLNGDGRVDAVFTQKQRYNQVCFGNGTGTFATCSDLMGTGQFQISNQINTTASALVDWDADGDLDIVLAMEGHASVVCYNDGSGQFNVGLGCVEIYGFSSFPYNSEDVAVGDLDGDGAPDLVFANGGNAGLPLNQPTLVCRGFNDGASACYPIGVSYAPSTGVVLGDVDGDGDLDVVVSNLGTLNEVCLNGGFNSNGPVFDCRAIPQATNVSATKNSNAVAMGYLATGIGSTPDGYLDVVFANDGTNEVCFGGGDWSGSNVGFACSRFNPVSSYTFSDSALHTVDVAIADFMPNPYAGAEIVFANSDGPNVRCFTTFTCTFGFQSTALVDVVIGGNTYTVSEPVPEASSGVAVRDINIDGKPDVVVANVSTSRSYMRADCCNTSNDVVAASQLFPTSITLSGGTVGPSADTEPPSFIGATAVTAEATGPTGAVATFTVTAVDVEDGPVAATCAPVSGSLFPLGDTTVTCTASDTTGNEGTATFIVTVQDTTGPAISVPSAIAVLAPVGQTTAAVTFTASAVDLVDGIVSVTCYNPATSSGVTSGDSFPGGTTTITCGGYDSRLNYGDASFTITVTTDIDGDGILDDVDLDDDGDGIADVVDADPIAASNSYRFDSTNTGTVTAHGWTVSITPTSGGSTFALRATLSGAGTEPAVIQAYCGIAIRKELRLDQAGETVEWRCDPNALGYHSLTVNFVAGTAEFWKVVCTGGCAWTRMTPTAGNTTVTAGSPVTAAASNTSPVQVTIFDDNGTEIGSFALDPGESVAVDVVEGDNGEPALQLELLDGGPDGMVVITVFGQTVTLEPGTGPLTFDLTPDVTPPTVTAQVSGTLGNNGYYTSDVTVTWTVIDEESTATTSGCDAQSVVQDTNGVTITCSAQSEGGTTSESVTIKRDATAPTVTVPDAVTATASGLSGATVVYAATVQDSIDATPSLVCAPASGSTFPVGDTTVVCTGSDAAGNTSAGSFVVSVAEAPSTDDDGDGVNNDVDAYPNSDVSATVHVGSCSTTVGNQVLASGATFNDLLASAAAGATNHGALVSAVAHLANGWQSAGLISGRDRGAITSCVAGAKSAKSTKAHKSEKSGKSQKAPQGKPADDKKSEKKSNKKPEKKSGKK